MRPLDKGCCPTDNQENPITVNDYEKWRLYLIDRIGYYCAYCNIPLSHSLQVEHVVPKDPPSGYVPGDPLAWDNMLLACGPCNRGKWNTPIDFANYYFPEQNNSSIPFKVIVSPQNPLAAIVVPREPLLPNQLLKAAETIKLTNLDNIDIREKIVDLRWKKRRDAMNIVDAAYNLYQAAITSAGTNLIRVARNVATMAISTGFFSIWYEKFIDEPEVMQALIDPNIIPGTAQNCFDATNGYKLIPRNPTDAIDNI
jgi:hypothetical protein